MRRKILIILGAILALLFVSALMLPKILTYMGLHPDYEGQTFNLQGRRALIITTSHDVLGSTGKKTGVYASEMTIPYYEFLDAKMKVDLASIKGGDIPVEPVSIKWPVATGADKRYLKDDDFKNKTQNSLKIDDVDFTQYDIIYIAGGWGASYDLGTSEILGVKITEANAKNILLGSVCHGVLGFLKAKNESGEPLLKDRRVTGVTNKQIKELGIEITPMHPETEIKKAGAKFEGKNAFKDIFANYSVIDGNLVTGQNQNAGKEVAQKMMNLLQAMQNRK